MNLIERINSALPKIITIIAYKEVPLEFNARHQTVKRLYNYMFFPNGLDLELMKVAC